MFDGSDASTELLKHLYPESITDSFVSLGKQEELLIEARDQVDREIKVLQEQKAEYENKIKAKLGTSEAGGTENYKVFGSPTQLIVLIASDLKQIILIYMSSMLKNLNQENSRLNKGGNK